MVSIHIGFRFLSPCAVVHSYLDGPLFWYLITAPAGAGSDTVTAAGSEPQESDSGDFVPVAMPEELPKGTLSCCRDRFMRIWALVTRPSSGFALELFLECFIWILL